MRKQFIFLLLVSLIKLYADDAAIRYNLDSGTVIPINNEHIEMVFEEVIYKDNKFTTEFLFLNTTNDTQSVIIGFPVIGDVAKLGLTSFHNAKNLSFNEKIKTIEEYYQFECKVRNKTVDRTIIPSNEINNNLYDFFYITNVDFQPLEELRIFNTYNYTPLLWQDSIMNNSKTVFYILETGKTWKNDIETAIIKIYIPNSKSDYYFFDDQYCGQLRRFSITGSPSDYIMYSSENNTVLEWNYKDIEPNFNIEVTYGYGDYTYYDDNRDNWIRDMYNSIPVHFLLQILKSIGVDSKEMRNIYANNRNFFKYSSANFLRNIYIPVLIDYIENKNSYYNSFQDRSLLVRFAINTIYAINGYIFNLKEWHIFYDKFNWYIPETNTPVFNIDDTKLIEKLIILRAKDKEE